MFWGTSGITLEGRLGQRRVHDHHDSPGQAAVHAGSSRAHGESLLCGVRMGVHVDDSPLGGGRDDLGHVEIVRAGNVGGAE